MAVDLSRYGIKVRRVLIHRNNTYEFLGDELPEGAWQCGSLVGGTVELYRAGPPPRKVKLHEVVVYVVAGTAVWAVVLVALPFVAIVVGVLLPLAAIGLLVRYLVRRRRR
jgi:hypothetical protein